LDGAPATIIVLLVIPRRGLAQHMRALPAIARLMDSPEVRSRLRGAQTAQQVIEVVRAAEERPSS
jgi:mannitol/fructose-specific phosphotransferase system IIA component (Ntr-type)